MPLKSLLFTIVKNKSINHMSRDTIKNRVIRQLAEDYAEEFDKLFSDKERFIRIAYSYINDMEMATDITTDGFMYLLGTSEWPWLRCKYQGLYLRLRQDSVHLVSAQTKVYTQSPKRTL